MLLQLAAQDIGQLPYIEQCQRDPRCELTAEFLFVPVIGTWFVPWAVRLPVVQRESRQRGAKKSGSSGLAK